MTEQAGKIQEAQERIRRVLRTEKQQVEPAVQAARGTLARYYAGMREELGRTGQYEPLDCTVLIHRIVATVVCFPTNSFPWKAFEKLPGARLLKPIQLRGQVYSKSRRILCAGGIREVTIEYERTMHCVAPFQITLLPGHKGGWTYGDLKSVLDLPPDYKLVKVEVAFDFPIRSIIDLKFIQRHALFAKTSPRYLAVNPLHDSWGGRKAMKFVRVYVRPETVRAELEAHSRMLRHYGINTPEDFPRLVEILIRKHILFARLDEGKLVNHLRHRKFSERRIKSILGQVRDKEECLWDVKHYLTKRVGLENIQRRLAPLPNLNQAVHAAAERWIAEWRKAQEQLEE